MPEARAGLDVAIEPAAPGDVPTLLAVQKRAFQSEADLYQAPDLPPMRETEADVMRALEESVVLKASFDGRLIGSVRGQLDGAGACYIGRLSVEPSWQGHGIGGRLMRAVEAAFPAVAKYTLITGETSPSVRLYERLGYRTVRREPKTPLLTVITMDKEPETEAGASPRGETR